MDIHWLVGHKVMAICCLLVASILECSLPYILQRATLVYKKSIGDSAICVLMKIASSFSGGAFIGLSLLHLLPEAIEELSDEQFYIRIGSGKYNPVYIFIFAGFSFILLLEKVFASQNSINTAANGQYINNGEIKKAGCVRTYNEKEEITTSFNCDMLRCPFSKGENLLKIIKPGNKTIYGQCDCISDNLWFNTAFCCGECGNNVTTAPSTSLSSPNASCFGFSCSFCRNCKTFDQYTGDTSSFSLETKPSVQLQTLQCLTLLENKQSAHIAPPNENVENCSCVTLGSPDAAAEAQEDKELLRVISSKKEPELLLSTTPTASISFCSKKNAFIINPCKHVIGHFFQSSSFFLFLALFSHSILEGILIGTSTVILDVWLTTLIIIAHKGAEGFALCTTLIKKSVTTTHSFVLLSIFVMASPTGALIGMMAVVKGTFTSGFLNSWAVGTLLYVAFEIIIEEFSGIYLARHRYYNFLAYLCGSIFVLLLSMLHHSLYHDDHVCCHGKVDHI